MTPETMTDQVNLAELARPVEITLPDATALMKEAQGMADDLEQLAREATTWRDRWHFLNARQQALIFAWHLSHAAGCPHDQPTYDQREIDTPWGISLHQVWENWLLEARGNPPPLT